MQDTSTFKESHSRLKSYIWWFILQGTWIFSLPGIHSSMQSWNSFTSWPLQTSYMCFGRVNRGKHHTVQHMTLSGIGSFWRYWIFKLLLLSDSLALNSLVLVSPSWSCFGHTHMFGGCGNVMFKDDKILKEDQGKSKNEILWPIFLFGIYIGVSIFWAGSSVPHTDTFSTPSSDLSLCSYSGATVLLVLQKISTFDGLTLKRDYEPIHFFLVTVLKVLCYKMSGKPRTKRGCSRNTSRYYYSRRQIF